MRGVWFCILTETNWPKVRDNCLYGVPKSKEPYRRISKTKPGDILIFYIRSPVKGIVGIYEVASNVFEESEYFPWEDRLYPYRIRIKPVSDDLKELPKPIPLEAFVGKVSKIKSPKAFMGKSMVSFSEEDYEFIKSLIKKGKKGINIKTKSSEDIL